MIARAEERRETNWIAVIQLTDGTEIPCTLKDVSKSGAKLGVPGSCPLPETFRFRVIGRDFVCSAKLAWRRGDYAGVAIDQVAKFKPAAPKVDAPVEDPVERAAKEAGLLHARRSRFSSR